MFFCACGTQAAARERLLRSGDLTVMLSRRRANIDTAVVDPDSMTTQQLLQRLAEVLPGALLHPRLRMLVLLTPPRPNAKQSPL